MTARKRRVVALALLTLAVAGDGEVLGSAADVLRDRAERYETRYRWSDQHELVRVTSVGGAAQPLVRTLELYERRYDDGRHRSLLVFQSPDRMKGTAVLSQRAHDGLEERWLYLPRLQRARRLAGELHDESVVGSDLTFRELDLMQRMLTWTERDARVMARDDAIVDGTPTYVMELEPRAPESEFGRLLLWLGKDDLVLRRLDIYAPEGGVVKRIRQSAIRFESGVPVAARVDVDDPRAATHSSFDVLEAAFDVGFPDAVFSLADMDSHRQ